jgi:small subunit ribosomal protein S20
MPNTKSAERRMRGNARKHSRNHAVKSYLHTLERRFNAAKKEGKKDDITSALKAITSALDKATKGGVIHRNTANRKKSRLTLGLAAKKA